jgi:hypothetical protein
MNRRVELVVSGNIIGTPLNTHPGLNPPSAAIPPQQTR